MFNDHKLQIFIPEIFLNKILYKFNMKCKFISSLLNGFNILSLHVFMSENFQKKMWMCFLLIHNLQKWKTIVILFKHIIVIYRYFFYMRTVKTMV